MVEGQQDLKCSAKGQCKTNNMTDIRCNTNIPNTHSSITYIFVYLAVGLNQCNAIHVERILMN